MKPLAPIRITDRTRRIRRDGGLAGSEIWAAETTDGLWSILREEVPGTPWTVVRKADKRHGGSYRTLDVARHAIACGMAEGEANRCDACRGSGHVFEWRYERGEGWTGAWQRGAEGLHVQYEHRAGVCACCGGSGEVKPAVAA